MKIYLKLLIIMLFGIAFGGLTVNTAGAATVNRALTVPTVGIGNGKTLGTIEIMETTYGSFSPGMQIIVTLPAGASYVRAPEPAATNHYIYIPPQAGIDVNALAAGDVLVNANSTDKNMILDVVRVSNPGGRALIHLLYNVPGFSQVNIYGGSGDFVVNILEFSGAVSSGPVGNSSTESGQASCSALNIPVLTAGTNREIGVISIRENMAGTLSAQNHSISMTLPSGMSWKGASISLSGGFLAGDVTINTIDKDESGCSRLWLDVNHNSIHQSGTTPGVIDISGTVDISEAVGTGELKVKIGGGNPGFTGAILITAMIDKAPAEIHNTAKFVVGSKTFTLNGVNKYMEAAPYIKDGRTFLPLYYTALALNIEEGNVVWNSVDRSATLKKGDIIVRITVGSNAMSVNGQIHSLDAKPEVKEGRTCLPISAIAEIFGYTANWEASSQTVTIQ